MSHDVNSCLSPHKTEAQFLQISLICRHVSGQDAAVDRGVKGLDPATKHLWKTSELRDISAKNKEESIISNGKA